MALQSKESKRAVHSQFSSPAYRRIQLDLRARIKRGVWPIGSMLPSRKDLATEYGVSVPTVERAVSDLLEDGTLRADGGRGTFVASRPVEENLAPAESMPVAPPRNNDIAPARSQQLGAGQPVTTHTIGIISFLELIDLAGHSVEQWKDTIINSVERCITDAGVSTVFYNLRQADGSRAPLETALRSLVIAGVKAIVVVFESDQDEIARAAASIEVTGVPVVFVGPSEIVAPVLSVYYDSRQAGYQAAMHLLQKGCRSLLYFAPYTVNWVLQRAAGVRDAVQWSAKPDSALQVAIADQPMAEVFLVEHAHVSAAYEMAQRLIAQGNIPDGVVAANDRIAYGFMNAASEAGLTVGRHYALVGFDDNPGSRELGLSTLRPPLAALGEEAGKLMLRAQQGEKTGIRVCLHSHLVARSSSQLWSS